MRIPSYFAFSQQTILKTPVPAQMLADTGVSLVTSGSKGLDGRDSEVKTGCFTSQLLLDGHANHVAPLSPRAVIIPNIVEAQEELQNKPRVGSLRADVRVQNYFRSRTQVGVSLFQFRKGAEGGIGIRCCVPLDVGSARDMSVAESRAVLGVAIGGKDSRLAIEFLGATGINQRPVCLLVDELRDKRAVRRIIAWRLWIIRLREVWNRVGGIALFGHPGVTTTIE